MLKQKQINKYNIMKIRLFILFCLTLMTGWYTMGGNKTTTPRMPQDALTLSSPDGQMVLRFAVVNGVPQYALDRAGKEIVKPSKLGFTLEWRDNMAQAFVMKEMTRSSKDETWQPVWGEEKNVRNHYNEMLVTLEQPAGKVASMDHSTDKRPTVMQIRFRLYDDGLGFRYEFPSVVGKQPDGTPLYNALVYFWIKEELTEFAMAGDHLAWWIPGDYDTQEFNYTESRLSKIRSLHSGAQVGGGWPWKSFSETGVQTALQMKTDDGLYINIHEAAVLDYPTANLDFDDKTMTFRIWLTPDATGYGARLQTPCMTPWRTVQVCETATDVLRSRLILNLNEPCALEDVSWIHPVKYMGVWWEMISDKNCWSYTNDFTSVRLPGNPSVPPSLQGYATDWTKAKPHGRHAANNENVRRYIDFAAKHGFDALLIEGWNIGWEDWYGKEKDFVFDFVTPYPDFDLPALNRYAHEKGIRLIMHHESSSSVSNYERWMDTAYSLMNHYGYDAVKSGYVGKIVPHGEHHYSQPIINHYHRAIVEAAKRHIMVNAHEAVRPTGLCRTWPNMIGNESAMGTEFRGGIRPGHTTILPFTRLQGGPMDYTPGIFETDMGNIISWGKGNQMKHTICNQLGLYVTFYSPLQMAADFPEHYEPYMDAFQFIKDVAVDWDTSLYLMAEPGAYIVTARHPKVSTLNKAAEGVGTLPDGKKDMLSGAARYVYALPQEATAADLKNATARDVWYVGGVTDENAREVTVNLDFLKPGVKYEAIIYCDGKDASGLTGEGYNPKSYTITNKKVTSKSKLKIRMAPCGGFAISMREISK